MRACTCALLGCLAVSVASPTPSPLDLLASASAWIASLDGLASNNVSVNARGLRTSIFINGDLARALLAASRITGNASLAAPAFAWCDALTALQRPITTSSGLSGGWWDTGYDELFIADTGTAVVAAELCWAMHPAGARRDAWAAALARFTAFVADGCVEAPDGGHYGTGCPPPHTTGWFLPDGSLGDGYYKGRLNNFSYTIATATTGSAFIPLWAALPVADHGVDTAELLTRALAAVHWLIRARSADGRIPYIITPADEGDHDLQSITYSTESFVIMSTLYPTTRNDLSTLDTTVAWLLTHQRSDGSWGNTTDVGEVERSPRAISLLQWYADTYAPHNTPQIRGAIDKWLVWVSQGARGLWNNDTLFMGFTALVLADLAMPGSTFPIIPV